MLRAESRMKNVMKGEEIEGGRRQMWGDIVSEKRFDDGKVGGKCG